MKIYTEVNYIWKDDKLVQTDSKSFDYEGEIESCHWYHSHKLAAKIIPKEGFKAKIESTGSGLVNAAAVGLTKIAEKAGVSKPGGTLKHGKYGTDYWRELSQKAGHHLTGSTYPGQGGGNGSGNTAADDQALADLNYSSRRGFQGKGTGKRVGSEDMRREPYAMNTKTLLTQGQKAKKLA